MKRRAFNLWSRNFTNTVISTRKNDKKKHRAFNVGSNASRKIYEISRRPGVAVVANHIAKLKCYIRGEIEPWKTKRNGNQEVIGVRGEGRPLDCQMTSVELKLVLTDRKNI